MLKFPYLKKHSENRILSKEKKIIFFKREGEMCVLFLRDIEKCLNSCDTVCWGGRGQWEQWLKDYVLMQKCPVEEKSLPGRKVSVEMCPAFWVMYWSIKDSALILIFLGKLEKIMHFWEKIVAYEMSKPALDNVNIHECEANSRIQTLSEDFTDLLSRCQGLFEPWGPAGC